MATIAMTTEMNNIHVIFDVCSRTSKMFTVFFLRDVVGGGVFFSGWLVVVGGGLKGLM